MIGCNGALLHLPTRKSYLLRPKDNLNLIFSYKSTSKLGEDVDVPDGPCTHASLARCDADLMTAVVQVS